MFTRTSTFAIAASLLFAVGCAATPADEEAAEENESSEQQMPQVDTDGIDPAATGVTCGCPAGTEYQNGLCYTKCAAGWSGEGPVCWQNCAAGFKDTGFFCHRDSQVISADTSRCPWYNKCGWNSDCNRCPAGWINDGCTCRIDAYIYAQPSYGRGAGTVPTCTQY